MKTTKILISICVALIMVATNLQSQVVIGKDKTPHTGAVLEVNNNSTNKGILLPKVSLTATETWGLTGTDAAEKGMVVFNTNKTISGTGANGEGMYYWNGAKWMWMAQDTTMKVASNGGLLLNTTGNDNAITIINDNKGYHADDIVIYSYGDAPSYIAYTSKGTATSPLSIQKSQMLGASTYGGYIKDEFKQLSGTFSIYNGNGNTNASSLHFFTSGTYNARMSIDSIGNVGIGTTSPASGLHLTEGKNLLAGKAPTSGALVFGTASNDASFIQCHSDPAVFIQRSSLAPNLYLTKNKTLAGGSINNFQYLGFNVGTTGASSTTTIGTISANATGTGLVYNATSDIRLKENITNTHYSLSDLMKISVKDYNFKSDETKTVQTGFLAQDLYEVYPEAVSVGGENAQENPWGVDYGKLTPLLVKAIQDQQKMIDELKKEIEALKKAQ